MKKIAVIDLGPNGFRLQIAESTYPGILFEMSEKLCLKKRRVVKR